MFLGFRGVGKVVVGVKFSILELEVVSFIMVVVYRREDFVFIFV